MKNVFLCLISKGKSAAKYFIFSTLFMLLGLLGVNSVEAATTISDYSPNTQNITGTDAITSINGTLKNECVSPVSDEELAYTIISASHKGNGNATDCIAYVETGSGAHQYFYLQADPDQTNTIVFTVNISTLRSDIAVFETGHSMADDNNNIDYDAYELNGTTYTGVRITSGEPQTAGGVIVSGTSGNYTLTFTYVLRNDDYGERNISVFFYEGGVGIENQLEYTTLKYTLAKPIDEYTFEFAINGSECTPTLGTICVLYTPKNNAGVANAGIVTNDFKLKMNKEAAIYFSTVNTHEVINPDAPTEEDVFTYNTIYATNVFYNDGEQNQAGKEIKYHYYNLKDSTKYSVGVSAKEENGEQYIFTLTVDASGVYNFTLQDIFENTVTSSNTYEITDLSNRELSIYFIAYDTDGNTVLKSGKTGVDSYELANDLDKLTAENVKIGLELYFKVKIENIYGVEATGSRVILMNPLYHNESSLNPNSQISTTLDNTYYCRLAASDSADCVAAAGSSKFTQHDLFTTQTIDARVEEGIKDVSNRFTYIQGVIEDADEISSTKRNNRVDVDVNENGIFFVRVQDIYGNFVTNQIEISIIDQLKPVITLNTTSSTTEGLYIDNHICSSMYVIGAGGTIQGYPEGLMSEESCDGNSVTYNNFALVDATDGTIKEDTVRVKIERPTNAAGGNATDTNGFYNTGTSSVLFNFNYADAIRMALLRVTDSVSTYNASGTASTLTEKSIYETTNNTYTAYGLYSVTPSSSTKTDITTSLTRINLKNDVIISSNYIHYSSEIVPVRENQYVTFKVYVYDENGTKVDDLVCDSAENENDCNEIVNTYIDKAISFELVFTAKDYVGNESNPITVKIDVIDDTNPGITKFNAATTEIETDPIIAGNNIDTECRLEIGSLIQTKNQLLECYGLLENGKYNFVDNATTYSFLKYSETAADNYASQGYYKYILNAPLYGQTSYASYDDSIKVYVCEYASSEINAHEECSLWKEVTNDPDTGIFFYNAGSYQIKFVISDTVKDYQNTHDANITTLIMCYYVNPRVLLVRPIETSKVYGAADPVIDYCVYATNNTNAFYYNLFNIPASGTYANTYDFILKNYESADFGLVYCTGSVTDDSSAHPEELDTVLANRTGDANKATLTGALGRTYATGNNQYHLEMKSDTYYNAYEDAGYYRITMGNLAIDEVHRSNYILRLHPSYLLDGETPNTVLDTWNSAALIKTDDSYDYTYGKSYNTSEHGETISNVLYTIEQAKLEITANGGEKIYGNVDTNYKQAFNNNASNNISTLNGTAVSVAGYLNGYTVTGLIVDADTTNNKFDYSQYNSIIQGYLRRETGEKVGKYYICNSNADINNTTITHGSICTFETININTLSSNNTSVSYAGIELTTSNVFNKTSSGYTAVSSAADIIYGMYVKIGSNYYKLTRNNAVITESTKTFDNDFEALLWRYNYDDSNYSVKILTTLSNNGNQNYYIQYTAAEYVINPRTIYVQPGINQGKEYSNPAHMDPIYEIVVYGEQVSITSTITEGTSFNGYTESVAAIGYPNDKHESNYTGAGASGNANYRVADTKLYFEERRTRANQISGTYVYQYTINITDNKFTLDGVSYTYDATNNKISATLDAAEVYNIDDGVYTIGINTLSIASNVVTVTLQGALTYQDYNLFTDASEVAGSGKLTRDLGETVGWYSYEFTGANLHAVSNGKEFCTHANYQYSVDGTGACSNYNVVYTSNAPAVTNPEAASKEFITTSTASEYKHDGANYCNNTNIYSYGCGTGVTEIKFSIFKRDIILSFDAQDEVYGKVYSYFENGIFKIADNDTIPSVITCYKKDSSAGVFTASNGMKYTAITDETCATVDYGLSQGDTWGSSGLGLTFFLHNNIADTFVGSYYPIPSGLYWVYAGIGTNRNGESTHGTDGNFVHDNYNLVYIDYDMLVAGGETDKSGALEITPRPVTITGTYYQKEYGTAIYATYQTNGSALTYTGNIQGAISYSLTETMIISIFDNDYYYCEATSDTYNGANISKGCQIEHNTSTDNKYLFSHLGNVYLYTVDGMVSLATTGKVDEIYANFAGTPVRERLSNANAAADTYGLLDDAGFYTISLDNIVPVIPSYGTTVDGYFDLDGKTTKQIGVIYRDNNYSITSKTNGGLYITPAQMTITVTADQKKMYGCAYNTLDTSITDIAYSYSSGYSNCIEDVKQYYDLGYEYTVTGDKAEYLKTVVDGTANYTKYTGPTDKETGAGNDYNYPTLTYTVTPNYTQAEGVTTTNGKPANTSLNEGTLYRIYSSTDSITYTYGDYYELSLKAMKDPNSKNVEQFQDQKVGEYAITLGSLDAAFNSNKQCDLYSSPVTSGGVSQCKNFIVNYGGNNTSTHTNTGAGTDDVFNTDDHKSFVLDKRYFKFEITVRKVVMTTEYNYKVHGDTEPNEGFTCQDITNMYTYTSGYVTDFATDGRSYCASTSTFISTGVTRFYAIDNSLAKAPWTGWIDNDKLYNDTLYDVLTTSSKVNRKGEGANAPAKGDAVGRYEYVYHDLYLSTTNENDDNYSISYLVSEAAASTNQDSASKVGFGTVRATTELDRWYNDKNHHCIAGTADGTNYNVACNAYTGTQTYQFNINGITFNNENSYKVVVNSSDVVSGLVPEVYFEIVRREIFVQTLPVEKDYGIEDKYNDFTVKLCSAYDETDGCTEVAVSSTWGVRNSLSREDYDKFYPSGIFSQSAFKGSDQDYTYRGATTGTFAKAFGIYLYRTAGEETGSYVIVACATQYANDLKCRNKYESLTDDNTRKTSVQSFDYDTPNNDYNASNYVVKTIPSTITINKRNVYIAPDANQGFMYGNYETGKLIAPITFKEHYGDSETGTSGLVNGSVYNNSDTINNQYALCIFDISERLTCINDRQNSSGGSIVGYVTTGLHEGDHSTSGTYTSSEIATKYGIDYSIAFNVYNDAYNGDNDDSRHALDRVMGASTNSQRYNRNVGTYTITNGDFKLDNSNYCASDTSVNCLNVNYAISGFKTGVTYTITPAEIVVTPKDNQNKIYGENDTHLDFTVKTVFTYDKANDDGYYCAGANSSRCQTEAFNNRDSAVVSGDDTIITLFGFAYEENDSNRDSYNYGIARVSNKSNSPQAKVSVYGTDGASNPKYYDKYCYDASLATPGARNDCIEFNNALSHAYASMTYTDTSRILLGYLYVEGWTQNAGTHNILNGIVVAKNEFDLVNYTYVVEASQATPDSVELGEDTGVDFTINKLSVTAKIEAVSKIYGQATDSHKCDSVSVDQQYNCNSDYATLNATDNEGRLEFNFDVVNTDSSYTVGVNTVSDKVLLTKAVNEKYYTQTANAEYKNIHLGLTVVRAINNNQICIRDNDKYGCEDSTDDANPYALAFRKQNVANGVDANYTIIVATADISDKLLTDQTGYAIVDSTTKEIDETEGAANSNKVEYTYYKNSNEIDTVPATQNSAESNNSVAITIVDGGRSTLTINRRDIMFYVGTYNDDATPAQRFVIEANEQVPEYPKINDDFTTSNTTPVKSKQIYFVTWFDMIEYVIGEGAPAGATYTYAPRQVRTNDDLIGADAYGVLLCGTASSLNGIQNEVYGSGSCSNTVSYADANNIEGGSYVFSTATIGEYAMVRNKAATYIVSEDNESRNYITDDHNGTLVIYEDQTKPVIQIGNDTFVLEANANSVNTCTTIVNTSGESFSYDCDVDGKLFDENNKSLGQIIEYLTNNYSGYNNSVTNKHNAEGSIISMPISLGGTVPAGWIYQPVNNIGVTSSNSKTTLYSVDRTVNTYDFDTNYINGDLEAISSIISWFNITSYDYAYYRTDFTDKRYTPRYYVYINGLSNPATGDPTTFDPTYVGDFTITIYAIDDVGNQAQATVTLKIVDTTKPVTGELHVFNAPVRYNTTLSTTLAKTNTIDDWYVDAGRVSINAFVKYSNNTCSTEDNTNGTYIKLNGNCINLYGNDINRYMTNNATTDTTPNIFGTFVNVSANQTKAVEVEHKYWSNNKTKYIVVVGGQDNSYIDVESTNDTQSQWDTYFTINGTAWYRYNRHDIDGVAIDFADGTNTIWTRVLDEGRYFTLSSVANGHTYYDQVFLRYVEGDDPACGGLSDCAILNDSKVAITQVPNVEMNKVDDNTYTFSIQSIFVTYDKANSKVVWEGQDSPASTSTEEGVTKFRFGIMTCAMDLNSLKVNCQTLYKLIYRPSMDVSTVDKYTYSISSRANIDDWDSVDSDSVTGFYKDRRYIFVDTAKPTLEMNDYRYSVYEFDTSCKTGSTDGICKNSYDEYFLDAKDTLTSGTTLSISGANVSYADLNTNNYVDIILYTGSEYTKVTTTNYITSGLLENDTLIMSGTNTYTNSHDNGSTFNKHYVDLVVYLNAKNAGDESDSRGRYIAIFNGSTYVLFAQTRANASTEYAVIQSFSSGTVTDYDTIEEILEYIVSTASVTATTGLKSMMTFSINYAIHDAANNVSEAIDSVTVRGVTYVKLSSTIEVDIPPAAAPANAGVSMVNNGNNVYTVTVNQGVSLSTLVNSLSISNVNKDGVNNMSTVKQALYYNGEVLFEGVSYNEDVFDLIQDYATTPGTYTLRLTSTREVNSVKTQGLTYTVEDTPLEINFVIKPVVASVNDTGDYSSNIVIIISMMMATLLLMGLGYISIKRIKK